MLQSFNAILKVKTNASGISLIQKIDKSWLQKEREDVVVKFLTRCPIQGIEVFAEQ